MRAQPRFPKTVWDGFSRNTQRVSLDDNVPPDGQDWSRVTAELIAMQEYALNGTVIDSLTIYTAVASVPITEMAFIVIESNGKLRIATSDDGLTTGLALATGSTGDTILFGKFGEITLSDWTDLTGLVNLQPGQLYYLRQSGLMSTTPPTTGYIVSVGEAISQTIFNLQISSRIKL